MNKNEFIEVLKKMDKERHIKVKSTFGEITEGNVNDIWNWLFDVVSKHETEPEFFIEKEIRPNMVVKKDGKLGKVIQEHQGTNLKFLPVKYGRYYSNQLETITADDVEIATKEEMVKFVAKEFSWGIINNTHIIGNYLIFEYQSKSNEDSEVKICYHSYIFKDDHYEDTNRSYNSLDSALIGVIAYVHDGINSQAAQYFYKMIGIQW